MTIARRIGGVVLLVALIGPSLALAQQPEAADTEPAAKSAPADANPPARAPAEAPSSSSVWDLLQASGGVGLTIALLSVAGAAIFFENLFALRRSALLPPGLAHVLHAHITAGEFNEAEKACRTQPSYLAYVVLAGLQEVRIGYSAVEKAMEDASQEQAARLFRKVEYLALIGNIAPMLGLLGTVYGLVLAFKKVAESQGTALAADLADGIYLALVTTVMGLVVAIPALSAYAIFRSRIEQLASEVNVLAEQIYINYKRGRLARRNESADTY